MSALNIVKKIIPVIFIVAVGAGVVDILREKPVTLLVDKETGKVIERIYYSNGSFWSSNPESKYLANLLAAVEESRSEDK